MADAAPSTFKRFVEIGRVVLLRNGPHEGRIAVISEIIDHNRAIIDGPLTDVPRQPFAYRHLTLTPHVVPNLERGASTDAVREQFEASGVLEKWTNSAWAKKREAIQKRRKLNDFERFVVSVQKKRRRGVVKQALSKVQREANKAKTKAKKAKEAA
ncbi:60S ribosomal protein L14 [Cantharellus anzutake]|uniref:60S ribosomal protein L14 n=1 Tax=Cantharellus anzutake TaxID=1750568 RepID=UPI001904BCB0|nr:60S ribosomal protein L14 [Cantharellus anzutake]KAF8333581.1 60S ribosomal protein L14 [Cantharellus anzutake]